MNKPKILIIGHARHGKDTLAEIWHSHFQMNYTSSSWAAIDIFLFDILKGLIGYRNTEECYKDRMNHRALWKELIAAYNHKDKAKLARQVVHLTGSYVGMRDKEELAASRDLFDLIVWVDASERLPVEDPSSFNIDKSCADIIIDNNDALLELETKAITLGRLIFNN